MTLITSTCSLNTNTCTSTLILLSHHHHIFFLSQHHYLFFLSELHHIFLLSFITSASCQNIIASSSTLTHNHIFVLSEHHHIYTFPEHHHIFFFSYMDHQTFWKQNGLFMLVYLTPRGIKPQTDTFVFRMCGQESIADVLLPVAYTRISKCFLLIFGRDGKNCRPTNRRPQKSSQSCWQS